MVIIPGFRVSGNNRSKLIRGISDRKIVVGGVSMISLFRTLAWHLCLESGE